MKKLIWISRDGKGGFSSDVILWIETKDKPELENGTWRSKDIEEDFIMFTQEHFSRCFGFLPKEETCNKYELSATLKE